jgi:hypothetical protein
MAAQERVEADSSEDEAEVADAIETNRGAEGVEKKREREALAKKVPKPRYPDCDSAQKTASTATGTKTAPRR